MSGPLDLRHMCESAAVTRATPEITPTIYVVDADDAVRDALATTLEAAGHAVALFGSARAFLDTPVLREPACLLVELDLPDIDGASLLALLRARHLRLPSIVMSRRLKNDKLAGLLPADVAGVLEKPFGDEELLGCIRLALAQPRERAACGAGLVMGTFP